MNAELGAVTLSADDVEQLRAHLRRARVERDAGRDASTDLWMLAGQLGVMLDREQANEQPSPSFRSSG